MIHILTTILLDEKIKESRLKFSKSEASALAKNPFENCFPTKFLAKTTFEGRKVY